MRLLTNFSVFCHKMCGFYNILCTSRTSAADGLISFLESYLWEIDEIISSQFSTTWRLVKWKFILIYYNGWNVCGLWIHKLSRATVVMVFYIRNRRELWVILEVSLQIIIVWIPISIVCNYRSNEKTVMWHVCGLISIFTKWPRLLC